MSGLLIAKRKGEQSHVFLHVCHRKALAKPSYAFSMDSLDDLLLAYTPEQFIRAVEHFSPLSLSPLSERENEVCPRVHPADELLDGGLEEQFEPIDKAVLADELACINDKLNKSSLARAAKEFDAAKSGALAYYLSGCAPIDDYCVVVEQVRDWVFAKTILEEIVRCQAYASHMTDVLGLKKPRTSVPLAANCELANVELVNPLLSIYFKRHWAGRTATMRHSRCIHLDSAGGTLWLVGEDELCDFENACDFVDAILSTTRELKSAGGRPLGWSDNDFAAALDEGERLAVRFLSQWAALVYGVAFHPCDVKSAVCKNCGRAMLNRKGKKLRQFCRPSCKTLYSRRSGAGEGQ